MTRRPSSCAAAVLMACCAAGPAWPAGEPPRTLAVQAVPAARQEQRLALVIGNAAYKDALLLNPVNDARAMAAALKQAGFTVLLHTDVDQRGLLNAVREFGTRLRQGGTGVFYFAGRGMQIKGRNFLVPVGADIQREDEVAYQALDAQAVLDKMEAAGNGSNLMILDACRNNPFARSFRSSSQGLAQMDAPVGTLVAFATAPGSVASDGQAANGLYTQHLLSAMRQPGLKVEDVFKQVRAAVRRDSQGKQVPWEATSLEGDLYFTAPPPAQPPADPALALDDAMWDAVKGSAEAADLRAYLRRFPQGRHAAAAAQQLAALTTAPALVAQAPVATAPPLPVPPAAAVTMPERLADVGRDRRTADLLSELARPAPAPAAPALAGAPAAATPRDERTSELLAELGRAKPAAGRPAAATPASNAQGFTVGDRWNYQVVDRWRGEVVRNYATHVAQIEADGGWLSSGGGRFDAHGRLMRWTNADGELRHMLPHAPRWWPGMQIGDKQSFSYEEGMSNGTGSGWVNRVETEARAVRIENVKVPAGEFRAWRIEHSGKVTAVGRPGYGTFTQTVWYVPELHTWVAFELESRWDGRANRRDREELTSITLVNHASTP